MKLSKIFSTFGIICFSLALVFLWQRNNPNRIAFESTSIIKQELLQGKKNPPVRLVIKNLKLDLPIFPAKINGQEWETTTKGISWLKFTPVPGEKGNSIIYGHNWENLLGKLERIRPGAKIEIIYADGSKKIFAVNSTAIVSPKDVSVLKQAEDSRITLYTCAGFFDEKRLVIVGKLELDSSSLSAPRNDTELNSAKL